MKKEIFTRYGNLKKHENLILLKDKVLDNTFVLECNCPFPGFYEYHQEIPFEIQPHYLYFVINELISLDKFIHATVKVKENFKHDFSATLGTIEWRNKFLPVIRIRRLNSFDLIVELQKAYVKAGIKFEKKIPDNFDLNCMIHLKKFFVLTKLAEGIYRDFNESTIYYFEIPKHVNWENFVEITLNVRNNVDVLQFDASKGALLEPYNIIHIVRIYSPDLDLPKIQQLKTKYIERI